MYYEVVWIPGLRADELGGRPNADEVGDDIQSNYEMAAERGGEVIAAHVLTFGETNTAGPLGFGGEYIYLVLELPDSERPDPEAD